MNSIKQPENEILLSKGFGRRSTWQLWNLLLAGLIAAVLAILSASPYGVFVAVSLPPRQRRNTGSASLSLAIGVKRSPLFLFLGRG